MLPRSRVVIFDKLAEQPRPGREASQSHVTTGASSQRSPARSLQVKSFAFPPSSKTPNHQTLRTGVGERCGLGRRDSDREIENAGLEKLPTARYLRCDLKHGTPIIRATVNCGAIEIAGGIPDKAGTRLRSVGEFQLAEVIQDSLAP